MARIKTNFMLKNKKLKILFLPTWYPSKKNLVSGVFIKEHAKAVSLYNEIIVLYSEGCEKELKKNWQIISDKEEDGIRTVRIKHKKSPIPKTTYFIYLWSIHIVFKKLLREGWLPDIIHAHIFRAAVPAVILGKLYKIPVVITEHCSGFPRCALTFFDRLRARFAMNKAKVILPVSKDLESAIRNYGIKNKFEVIPNVVNTDLFYPLLARFNSCNREDGIKRVLLVALLSPKKGISYLLKALALLRQKRKDFVLDIVGDGPNRKEYEKITKDLELDGIVKFYGIKPKEEVAEFMRNCDFFVLPSLYETFGVVYIEAMACGKPIVATRLPVLQELITQERGILIPPRDIEALSNVIDNMLDRYQDYSPEKIAGYAKEKFSYRLVGQQIDKIYRSILQV
jgi:L-malate glycosyltransferase